MDRNFVEFRLAPGDVSAIRFGVSPGHELCHAVRILQRPADQPLQWGWLRRVRDAVPREAFELFAVIVRDRGYFPDFLTSTPTWDLEPVDEVERLREVPDELMRVDLGKVLVRSEGARRDAVQRMLDDLPRARAMIARSCGSTSTAYSAPARSRRSRSPAQRDASALSRQRASITGRSSSPTCGGEGRRTSTARGVGAESGTPRDGGRTGAGGGAGAAAGCGAGGGSSTRGSSVSVSR